MLEESGILCREVTSFMQVLILVLMEYARRDVGDNTHKYWHNVLILVLMEYARRGSHPRQVSFIKAMS